MSAPSSHYRCAGCGTVVRDEDRPPFRCPNVRADDDVDHVLVRELDLAESPFPSTGSATGADAPRTATPRPIVADPLAPAASPFVRFRRLLHSYHLARAGGIPDKEFVDLIHRLDAAVADVDGAGFRASPLLRADALSDALGFSRSGGVWIKDETGQVGGSHKARHLFGVALHLTVRRRLGLDPESPRPRLAIASCGNAALAAGVVARAGGYELDVFVPTDADPETVENLRKLNARIVSCPRKPDQTGDPCVSAFREAVASGALPFSCQGNENGSAIEGGHTLGWEIARALPDMSWSRLFVQVGGGALATSVWTGLQEARERGVFSHLPRLHTVQTEGGHPLTRAYEGVRRRLEKRSDGAAEDSTAAAMRYAATHRSEFMWPWESPPASLAEGILDDETYDWQAVVRALLESDGHPITASEDQIRRANEMADSHTEIPVGYTGSAGLAGVLAMRESGEVTAEETVLVLFTGVRRGRGG